MRTSAIRNIIITKNIYSFKFFLYKDKNKIYEIIRRKFIGEDVYNVYFKIMIDLWYGKILLKTEMSIEKVLEIYIAKIYEAPVYNLFDRRKSFPSLNDITLDGSILVSRKLLYVNEIILETLLLEQFQDEINEPVIEYKKLVSFVKRNITAKGEVYDREETIRYREHLYILTDRKIYIKKLNTRFEVYKNEESYKVYKFSDIIAYRFIDNRSSREKVSKLSGTRIDSLGKFERPLELVFSNGEVLTLMEGVRVEFIDLKKYIASRLDYKYAIKKFEMLRMSRNII
ncbi:hypothetical protein [Cetobacterium sp.]|uniref:hypothetical protein n=1 Tax=Cetobacterium sp. TaxID=2071632 RepID=UPI003F30F12A